MVEFEFDFGSFYTLQKQHVPLYIKFGKFCFYFLYLTN
jgi:hypothetical protein